MSSNPGDANDGKQGKLLLVATPIGNLADITYRAIETLRAVDIIAAEDTRRTRKLLSYFEIHKPLVSYHEHNAQARGGDLIERIISGGSVALVTDAGTPCISDPGRFLVEAALERGIEPIAVPGPTALICALIVSGLAVQPFVFLGFVPARGAERRRFFENNAKLEMTLILYESPKRLIKTLKDISEYWGERKAAVARELTKMHEEVFRGRISEALAHFSGEVRGEVVLVVEGAAQEADRRVEAGPGRGGPALQSFSWKEELKTLVAEGVSAKEAVQAVARRCGLPRRVVYQAILEMKKNATGSAQ